MVLGRPWGLLGTSWADLEATEKAHERHVLQERFQDRKGGPLLRDPKSAQNGTQDESKFKTIV
jgi:hypothetical protein